MELNGAASPPTPPDSHEPAKACVFVLFGATGDLTKRKIVPALYSLYLNGLLPRGFAIVAFARRDKDDTQFRAELRDHLREFAGGLDTTGSSWDDFSSGIFYLRSTFDDPEGYERLARRLEAIETERNIPGNRLFYMATPPENFSGIIAHLGGAGLNRAPEGGWARIIVEKPFGTDSESAHRLNVELGTEFQEDQIYRIDHYLGKETVQNILVLRFANQIFEPIWNQKYIDHVQITVAETLGVEGRGGYFEEIGITRDIVQNHLLQILTLIAMEPPVALNADDIRDEKVKVLKSIRPFSPEEVPSCTVRGQYGAGRIGDREVPGYREEEGVDPQSQTETYAAFKFQVNNWRWSGVPFYVQAGKRMPTRLTEVKIQFKAVPDVLFARLDGGGVKPNILTLRIQPDEGASLEIGSKPPGPDMHVQSVRLDFQYGSAFNAPIRDAYERLILDAIRGDASLFARNDEVEAAWGIVSPILAAWRDLSCPLFPNYAAGTWGPEAAAGLMAGRCGWLVPG